MKTKPLIVPEGSFSPLLIFVILSIIIFLILCMEFWGEVSSFFDLWFLSLSLGTSTFIFTLMNIWGMIPLPSNFYKTDGNRFLFYNNRIGFSIKIILLIFSTLLFSYAMYFEPENSTIGEYGFYWIDLILSIILFLVFFGIFYSFFTNWFNNKNDKLILDANKIHSLDTEYGEKMIKLNTVQEIEFVDNIINFKGKEDIQINLFEMNLHVFKDKIKQELTRLCPKIIVTEISPNDEFFDEKRRDLIN